MTFLSLSDIEVVDSVKRFGSQRAAARELNVPKSTFQERYQRALKNLFVTRSLATPVKIPVEGRVKRFIFSSAQDGTEVHGGFLRNLEAFARHVGAEIHIGGFTYNKALFENHAKQSAFYHPRIEPYLTNRRFEIGDNLLFCGEMNTLPSAVSPLDGFETYTRSKWGIFPHAKVQLRSIPTSKFSPTKIIMTTGAVTLPNYVQKRAGIRAEFHHVIGAVLVELDTDGSFFCRHLLAEKDGSFCDLEARVQDGQIFEERDNVLAITFGDIHHEKLDETVKEACFDPGGMIDQLQPDYAFIHDLSDFSPRNHHNISDPYFRFEQHGKVEDNVASALWACGQFLNYIARPWMQTIVVESNHDLALFKWLKTADYRSDPENAIFFLEAQLAQYKALDSGDKNFGILKWAIAHTYDRELETTRFLRTDESFLLGGIEYGGHGDLGANGMRGSIKQFTKFGPKAVIGHAHSAGIEDGITQVGVSCKLDMTYNKGASSWTQTHCVTYKNNKRALITMQNGKWRANQI